MKKRFLLAAVMAMCMMVMVMPVAFAEGFPSAEGGTITLTENTEVSNSDWSALWTEGVTAVTIDLGQNTLTISDDGTVNIPEGKTLNLKNGKIVANAFTDGAKSVFSPLKDATITMDNIEMETTGTALFPAGEAAAVVVTDSNIKAGIYAVGTNASTANGALVYSNDVKITLTGSTIEATGQNNDYDTCTVMLNVPGTLDITDCTIIGYRQVVFVRGGTVNIQYSDIQLKDGFAGQTADDYDNANWGSGNEVPMAALLIGNRGNSAYQYEANCKLSNTDITVAPTDEEAIYLYQMVSEAGVDRNVTLDIDGGTYTGTVSINHASGAAPAEVTIASGTFSSDVSAYLVDTVKQDSTTGQVRPLKESDLESVACIGKTYYRSL